MILHFFASIILCTLICSFHDSLFVMCWQNTFHMVNEDLSRPCDACGMPIGGGYRHCPKCKIYFCFYCGTEMIRNGSDYPLKCHMRGEKLQALPHQTRTVFDASFVTCSLLVWLAGIRPRFMLVCIC